VDSESFNAGQPNSTLSNGVWVVIFRLIDLDVKDFADIAYLIFFLKPAL